MTPSYGKVRVREISEAVSSLQRVKIENQGQKNEGQFAQTQIIDYGFNPTNLTWQGVVGPQNQCPV